MRDVRNLVFRDTHIHTHTHAHRHVVTQSRAHIQPQENRRKIAYPLLFVPLLPFLIFLFTPRSKLLSHNVFRRTHILILIITETVPRSSATCSQPRQHPNNHHFFCVPLVSSSFCFLSFNVSFRSFFCTVFFFFSVLLLLSQLKLTGLASGCVACTTGTGRATSRLLCATWPPAAAAPRTPPRRTSPPPLDCPRPGNPPRPGPEHSGATRRRIFAREGRRTGVGGGQNYLGKSSASDCIRA